MSHAKSFGTYKSVELSAKTYKFLSQFGFIFKGPINASSSRK